MKWTEKDFIETHRKMFQALITLGFIIKDYSLRRLCIQAAKACEPSTFYSAEILEQLPEVDAEEHEVSPEMKTILLHLREQLETFQSAIRTNVSLPKTWEKTSIECYEKLNYLNRRVELSEDLQPLPYPGIERYLKKLHKENPDESEPTEKKPLDASKILNDCTDFCQMVSDRLKQFSTHNKNVCPPLPTEVTAVMIKALSYALDYFEFGDNGQIFMKLSNETSLEKLKSYSGIYDQIDDFKLKCNKPNLLFDFDMTARESSERKKDFSTIYCEGAVSVYDLCNQGFSLFDIENVMLYTIMEKKMKFSQAEFAAFNKNKAAHDTENQAQHAFTFLICRSQPEHSRVKKVLYVACSSSMFDFNLEHFSFEVIPGRYKAKKKNSDLSIREDAEVNGDENAMDTSEEPATIASTSAKKVSKKSPKVPKIALKKESRTEPMLSPESLSASQPNASQPNVNQLKPKVSTLDSDQNFHASDALLGVFLRLENELSNIAGVKVTFNLKQMTDESSPHKIGFISSFAKEFKPTEVKVQKRRNQRNSEPVLKEIWLPAHTHGAIIICMEIVDEIVYDENNDNPWIKSTQIVKLNGGLTIDYTSWNVKNLTVNCNVAGVDSKIRISLRHEHRSKCKRPAKGNSTNSAEKDGKFADPKLSESSADEATSVKPKLSSTTGNLSTNAFADDGEAFSATNFQVPSTHFSHSQAVYREPIQATNSMVSTAHSFNENYSTTNLPSPPYAINADSSILQSPTYQEQSNETKSATLIRTPSANFHQATSYTQPFQANNGTEPEVYSSQVLVNDPPYAHFPPVIHTEIPDYVPSLPEHENKIAFEPSMVVSTSPSVTAMNQSSSKVLILQDILLTTSNTKADLIAAKSLITLAGRSQLNNGDGAVNSVNRKTFRNREDQLEANNCDASKNGSLSSVNESIVDFDEILPSTQVVKAYQVPVIRSRLQEQTPPTSPPPLHYRKDISEARKSAEPQPLKKFRSRDFECPADRIINFTSHDEVNEVIIDLTEDAEPPRMLKRVKPKMGPAFHKPCPKSKKTFANSHFVSCHTTNNSEDFGMLTTEVEPDSKDLIKKYSRVMKKLETKRFLSQPNGAKRIRMSAEEKIRESEVHVVNVFEHMDLSVLMRDMYVNAHMVRTQIPANVSQALVSDPCANTNE